MAEETSITHVTEYEDGSKIVTTETIASEYVEPGETSELAEAIGGETIEPVVDAAVEIARIEAERDITIAAIESETTQAVVEGQAEQRDDEWQRNTEARLAAMDSRLEAIQTLLTPQQLQEVPPSQAENNPAPESAAVTPDSLAVAEVAPEPPKRPKRSRWI